MGCCAESITAADYGRLPLRHYGWSFFRNKAIQGTLQEMVLERNVMETVCRIAETVISVLLCKEQARKTLFHH